MKEFLVRFTDDLHQISGYIFEHFETSDETLKIEITQPKGTGKWGMSRLWRLWMRVTADYMAQNGSTMPLMMAKDGSQYGSRPFNERDAHELFTSQWLGLNSNGERLSWKASEGKNVADKGQRYIAMMKHQNWCIEKGINLPMPRNSEYADLEREQNE